MLSTYSKPASSGFSLIELMIGITIMAALVSAALPSFQTWMLNTKIRTAAEAVQNGLQRARAEAVSRNTNVAFSLEADSSWSIDVAAPASNIEKRSAKEGSKYVTRTVLPAGATTLTYNNLGGVNANQDGSAALTQVDLAASGSSKTYRVLITVGIPRMCDPDQPPNSSPSACP